MVTLKSPCAVQLRRIVCRPLQPDDMLCPLSPVRFRFLFRKLATVLGLDYLNLTWYSLRRGGATANFLAHGNLELTLQYGRWASSRNTKRYVMQGVAEAVKLSITPSLKLTLEESASYLADFVRR